MSRNLILGTPFQGFSSHHFLLILDYLIFQVLLQPGPFFSRLCDFQSTRNSQALIELASFATLWMSLLLSRAEQSTTLA